MVFFYIRLNCNKESACHMKYIKFQHKYSTGEYFAAKKKSLFIFMHYKCCCWRISLNLCLFSSKMMMLYITTALHLNVIILLLFVCFKRLFCHFQFALNKHMVVLKCNVFQRKTWKNFVVTVIYYFFVIQNQQKRWTIIQTILLFLLLYFWDWLSRWDRNVW